MLLKVNPKKRKQRVIITCDSSWLKGMEGTLVPLSPKAIQYITSHGQNSPVFGVDFGKKMRGHTGAGQPICTHFLFGSIKTETGFLFLKHEFILVP